MKNLNISDAGKSADTAAREGSSVCGDRHTEPAWLGAIRGTEWWHCRSCGWVWHELRTVQPAEVPGATSVSLHQRE